MADLTHQAPTKLRKPDPVWAGLSMGELGKIVGVALLALGPVSQLTAWLPQPVHVAVVVAGLFAQILQTTLNVDIRIDGETFLLIAVGGVIFAAIGSCYPVFKGIRLSPIQAMKNT